VVVIVSSYRREQAEKQGKLVSTGDNADEANGGGGGGSLINEDIEQSGETDPLVARPAKSDVQIEMTRHER
jgi:hypothetical protein